MGYIAHSRISENGTIYGEAGDQIGTEVCVQEFYLKPWNCVIRIDNEDVRRQFANNMIDIANNNAVGYCQSGRNSLLTEAIKVKFDFTKIKIKCECDCSSAVTICLLGAIYTVLGEKAYNKAYDILVTNGNCSTTHTLKNQTLTLKKKSIVSVSVYTETSYINGTAKAVFGDIYLKEGSHVVAYVDDGKKVGCSTPTTDTDVPSNELKFKVGDIVNFTGSTHYTSAYSGGIAKNCTPGQATVEQIVEGKPHPYLLKAVSGKGSTVHGWVNANDVKEISNESSVDAKPSTSSTNVIGTAVAKSTMKMRKASNTLSKVVGYVSAGSTIEVLEVLSNNWYKIVCLKESCGYAYVSNAGNKYFTYTENKTNNTSATKKYVSNGIDYTLVFDPTYYANKHADLKKAFGTDEKKLFNHFLNYGMKEARQACATFNVTVYKNTYADLRKAFGNNLPAYYKHYVQFGHKEGRKTV